ncbi:unnamed protein product [Aureobasidium vineae]|uniref:Uncharacterized protein n=1 Tax=Aureobasidium vineae TaxID=2773715 RepID=A0A9N8JCY3_9PEZI|nr:unnamed protein product [Aureobasidium vineae]
MVPTVLVFNVLRRQGSWLFSCVTTWALFCGATLAQSKTNSNANPWVLDYKSEAGPNGPWNAVTQLVDFPEQRTGMWTQTPAHSLSNWVNISIPDASKWDVAADPLALKGSGTLTKDRIVLWSADRTQGPNYVDGSAISIASNYTVTDSVDTSYTLDVGMLSLHTGLDTINWTTGNGSDVSYGRFINRAYQTGSIPSVSFGLHVGSVWPPIPGSLVLGGYDRSRCISTPIVSNTNEFSLAELSLEVTSGGWPFLNATKVDPDYLLRSDDASTNDNDALTVMPNPGVPYMYLPKDTCSTIATFLPVTFDQSLGHYIWNTTKPAFKKIMSSPSALKFAFRTDSGIENISVPFALLNLTLDYPLVSTPTQYFPCAPYTPSNGAPYHLGRAFLQAAFLGQHGQAQKTFLAQAPGPGAKAEAITNLASTDTTLTAMANPPYWNATWSDQLKALPNNNGTASDTMAGGDDAPASPLPPRRPPLGHRHSSTSSHVSQSPSDSTTKAHHKSAHHKPQRHVVSHHNRMGSRNPSFHRSLSKIKIQQHDSRQHDDDEPPTPKAKQQASVASQSTLVPPSPARPNMKRNNTSVHLPRNHSHAGLKKNLSSGQLSRLTAAKTTAHGRTTSQHQRPDIRRAHTQPYKRSKSPAPKASQVAFDVGDDDDDDDDGEEMEGVDDQWTEESASASPNTTRDNTRNNTRQNSVVLDPKLNPYARQLAEEEAAADSSGSDTVGSRSPPKPSKAPVSLTIRTKDFAAPQATPTSAPQQQLQQKQPPTSSYNAQVAQQHMPDADAIARRLLERNSALNAAPPRVSSVSALANPSPADPKSLLSLNAGQSVTGGSNTPLVSRFISNDGINSKDGTPADQSDFLQGPKGHSRTISQAQTRKEQSDLYRNQSTPNFASQKQPPTPSGSGAVTPDPALNQSRTQQKLWLQRGLSNIEASSQPHLPGLLPTGRAQAMRTPHAGKQFEFVDKEWAVVRRFQNPLDAGLERLRKMNGGSLPGKPNKSKAGAAQQHSNGGVNGHRRGPSNAASIASKKSDATVVAEPTAGRKSRVSFHMGEAEGDNDDDEQDEHNSRSDRETPADIARRLWDSPIGIQVEG